MSERIKEAIETGQTFRTTQTAEITADITVIPLLDREIRERIKEEIKRIVKEVQRYIVSGQWRRDRELRRV